MVYGAVLGTNAVTAYAWDHLAVLGDDPPVGSFILPSERFVYDRDISILYGTIVPY